MLAARTEYDHVRQRNALPSSGGRHAVVPFQRDGLKIGHNTPPTFDDDVAKVVHDGTLRSSVRMLCLAVRDNRLDRGELKALEAVIHNINGELGVAWPSRQTLANRAGANNTKTLGNPTASPAWVGVSQLGEAPNTLVPGTHTQPLRPAGRDARPEELSGKSSRHCRGSRPSRRRRKLPAPAGMPTPAGSPFMKSARPSRQMRVPAIAGMPAPAGSKLLAPSGDSNLLNEVREERAPEEVITTDTTIIGPWFKLDLKAIDMVAAITPGMTSERARQLAEICAHDWVANKFKPAHPMALVSAAIKADKNRSDVHGVRMTRAADSKPPSKKWEPNRTYTGARRYQQEPSRSNPKDWPERAGAVSTRSTFASAARGRQSSGRRHATQPTLAHVMS